ncbi:MAG: secondary thiamine-phosphate synthase enzyme YjbQ [archaeon]
MEIDIKTSKREEIIDITGEIERVAEGRKGSICLVYCQHTSAGVMLNEAYDPGVVEDLLDFLGKISPKSSNFRHKEGNSDAHIKAMLVGSSVSIPLSDGKLGIGKWQRVLFGEFDGPRGRKIIVKII